MVRIVSAAVAEGLAMPPMSRKNFDFGGIKKIFKRAI
jgi:hypothetical protein